MNKLNPLILTAVLFFVLLVAAFKVADAKNELRESAKETANAEILGKRITTLKKVWSKAELDARVKSVFGEANVKDKGRTLEASVGKLGIQELENLIAKSMSESFEIEKISVLNQDGNFAATVEIVK